MADGGHLPSAQLALLMHDQGRALFGSDWSASPGQRRPAIELAAQASLDNAATLDALARSARLGQAVDVARC